MIHIDAGEVHVCCRKSFFERLANFGDSNFASGCHSRREIHLCGVEVYVSKSVSSIAADQSKITRDCLFKDAVLPFISRISFPLAKSVPYPVGE